MEINIDDIEYDILLHDLDKIAHYIAFTRTDCSAKIHQQRLLEIKQKLIQSISTKE